MKRAVAVTVFRVRNREPEVEHQPDRVVVGVRLPAVARQQLEVDGRQAGNDTAMASDDRFGLAASSEHARHEETRRIVASRVKQIEDLVVSLGERDLMRVRVERKAPLINRPAAPVVTDRWKIR